MYAFNRRALREHRADKRVLSDIIRDFAVPEDAEDMMCIDTGLDLEMDGGMDDWSDSERYPDENLCGESRDQHCVAEAVNNV